MEELRADVVIVGFGVAGACAAIEAARAGAEVVVLDRFEGGGTSRLSGGVIYAGGGTTQQQEAGVADSPEDMYAYLREETGDAVSPATLRRFCEESPAMIAWLQERGVPFDSSLCPYKTSYPSNRHYLYYSGSEASGGFRDIATPAPRGHRTKGRGTSGKVLFAALAEAARAHGVRVLDQTRADQLITEEGGAVRGVECSSLRGAPFRVRAAHRLLARRAAKPGLYVPALTKKLHARVEKLERRHARPLRVHGRGVVLTAGGFVANRDMMRTHAPSYRGGLPLGTRADDGSGISLGMSAGGAVDKLGRISAWRFITPPSAFLGAVLVDATGARIGDESRYGATLGEDLMTKAGGRGWLLIDDRLRRSALRQLRGQSVWFQLLQALYLLNKRAVRGTTVEEAATRAGIDPAGLRDTVEAYNAAAGDGSGDPAEKPAEFVRQLERPPYSLLDISIRPSVAYPCPMLTLGGLVVDERTGLVRDRDGSAIEGLYAAGRTAVGVCSNSYVSGLSLADAVFAGRRAGEHLGKRSTSGRLRAHE